MCNKLVAKYVSVSTSDRWSTKCATLFLSNHPVTVHAQAVLASFHERIMKQIKVMEKQGIIRPSRSAFPSPLVLRVKKDGRIRLCIDFRNLNQHVLNDSYRLPNIDNILPNLWKGKIFSCLDLKKAIIKSSWMRKPQMANNHKHL